MSSNGYQDARAGDALPGFTAGPISRHALALYCGASGDHNPIHVDLDFARSAGMDDVFDSRTACCRRPIWRGC